MKFRNITKLFILLFIVIILALFISYVFWKSGDLNLLSTTVKNTKLII